MLNKTLAMREHDSVSPAVQPKQCTMVLSLSAIIQMLLSGHSFIESVELLGRQRAYWKSCTLSLKL